MKPPLYRSQLAWPLCQAALALLMAVPLTLTPSAPADANILGVLRSIFSRETSGGAQGNARATGIRDRRCGLEAQSLEAQWDMASPSTATRQPEQLLLLLPNISQTLTTTTATPTVFVYIPPSATPTEPASSERPEPKASHQPSKIDITDIDSVIDDSRFAHF